MIKRIILLCIACGSMSPRGDILAQDTKVDHGQQVDYARLSYSKDEVREYLSELERHFEDYIGISRRSTTKELTANFESKLLSDHTSRPLAVEIEIMNFLGSASRLSTELSPGEWSKYRHLATRLIFNIWKKGTDHIDPNFDPDDRPLLRVCPPAAANPRFCGVAPETIKDPILRQQYEQAIAENNRKTRYYNEQDSYRRSTRLLLMRARRQLARYYSRDPPAIAELEALAISEIPDREAREEIMEPIRAKLRGE